jgi:FMN-dependent oxidoreductase (nitrilotriacetate monooxygenase family)
MSKQNQMVLGVFFNPTGHHSASWRHPDAEADAGINFSHYAEIARTAERAKFHLLFLADNIGVRDAKMEALSRSAQYIANFEPMTLLSALSAVTEKIGLVATASTSYNEPFHVARKFASIDHLSGGRAGWNIVTSTLKSEANNFGREEHLDHKERYERAREFTEVVMGLWDSWDDDAFPRDKLSGLFFEPDKLHTLNHKGRFFNVRGPLNVPRSPQGCPVLVQAGASDDGREFASEFAEIIFTNHLTKESGKAYYADLKARAAKYGRSGDQIKVLPGLSPVVGRTSAEAEERFEYLQSLIDPIVAREMLSTVLGGADLSGYQLDGPLPDLPITNTTIQSALENWTKLARSENLTIRQLALRAAGARGKSVVRGSPTDIADIMEDLFKSEAADGFNIMPPYLPGSLNDFVDLVVPELQRRGIFRTEYSGATLRENLGLQKPSSRYQAANRAAATA